MPLPGLTSSAITDPGELEERLAHLPQSPGVYLWKDDRQTILYIGKSKNLYARMRSYFGAPSGLSAKTRRLVGQIADFEVITTQNELEALLLEMNLIKQHRPRYNVLLKDDKTYPYIKVTLAEAWPRIFPTRTVLDDGARYFGPYASAGSVRTTLDMLNRLFAFRPPYECGDRKFVRHQRAGKPCLSYDLKRCLGPCVPDLVSQADYRAAVEAVCRFLEGKSDHMVRDLRTRMEQAAEDLNFERAASLRDQLQALEHILEKQQVLRTVNTDQDVIAFARDDGSAVVQVLFIRGGKLIGSEPYPLQGTDEETDAHLLTSFLTQFYHRAPDIPPFLLLADYIEEPMIIEQWLSEKRGHRVDIQVPRRGEKRRLVELATQNATRKLEELRQQWLSSDQRATAVLSELRDILKLPGLPQRIECYDISNTQGSQSVASMVVFTQGKPDPAAYRRFKIKTIAGANDVASIYEVIHRRFKRAATTPPPDAASPSDPASWAQMPDLLLVDGGAAQVQSALTALRNLGLDHIPTVGVAKGINRDRFDLVGPGWDEPLALARDSHLLNLVRQIDEEAHRFAIAYHRKLRQRATLRSPLDDVPGIGPQRKRALLKAFGSLDAIRQATVEELIAVPGITRTVAEALKAIL
ncbi:MAG: excinuclease ABC subunit UvrC [Chloroflexaceae bacterium]|nr:excinuclease ABC subunit UvrC [Chloroflexaceae bacterium]